MSYIVLARKWRPQKFSEVVGQGPIIKTLENAIRLGRVSHAVLLTGSRGVGKTTTARILAKSLNCEKGPTVDPCGECSNCREIASGSNVDVFEVDGASNTTVDQIRDLLENVQYRPSKSRNKIYIIDEVHMLSTHSFNALLKTLEEPPPGVMFIFATTEPHKIPDTIHSRCQRFDLRNISDEQIAEHLKKIVEAEKIGISESGLLMLARQAAGSLRDALSLLDQAVAYCGDQISDEDLASVLGLTDRQLIGRTLDVFVRHDSTGAMDLLAQVFGKGFDPKTYLSEVWGKVRDLLVLKGGADERIVKATADEREHLKKLASGVEEAEIERWFDLLKGALLEIGRTDFPRFLVEVNFLKITRQSPRIPLSELTGRLERLEAKLGAPGIRSAVPGPGSGEAEKPRAKMPVVEEKPEEEDSAGPEPRVMGTESMEQLIAAAKRRKPAWAAILLQATRTELAEGRITLMFEEGSFYEARAKDRDFQEFLVTLARELFGVPYRVKIETQNRSAPTAAQQRNADRGREKEALENPVVQRAVSLFDARIDEVKSAK
ncbi:MAG: DNA polymerase III subunit gamma/tau [Pseudomonadota bacterium]